MKCSIEECENKVYARNWCHKHYIRWWKYNDPFFIKRHGYRDHPLYNVWDNMKQRCYNKNHLRYDDWGGRGIIVCDEWMNPKIFIEWCLENGWKAGLQIDRKNNDGNYTSENCRFVTAQISSYNTRLLRKDNISSYRGICWDKERKKWISYISINNKRKHLGRFNSSRLAALRYDVEAYLTDSRPRNFF